ncbi:MAG: ammonium transporter [Nitriliruptorales bacterium]|nr:ammonium transporter [Nitriliruptorales bacterium]
MRKLRHRKLSTSLKVLGLMAAISLVTAAPALAQEEEFDLASMTAAIDTIWVAVAAALVLLMHLGFGMLEAGLTRAKNAANIVGKNMITVAIGGAAYWAVGAAFAYGDDSGSFLGTSGFFDPITTGLGDGTQVIFQLVFAATAATIVSGAVAERIDFKAYVILAVALTAVIYPIVSHWQWSGDGWLSDQGFYDFAGSTIVHLTGGTAALVVAGILGPRIGKYSKDGKPRAIPGHSIPLAIFGVLVLWFGWFGFNGGSTLAAVGSESTIGVILLNTTVAGSFGAIAAMIANWVTAGKPDPAMIGNGALAGLVGITAGPDLATGTWAMIVGLVCGVVVVFAVMAFDRIRIDDPVGATSVHLVCGAIGTIFVGIYSDGHDVGTQALGVISVFAFVAVTTAIVAYLIKLTIGLRVPEEIEIEGLDLHEHGVAGLPDLGGGIGAAIG